MLSIRLRDEGYEALAEARGWANVSAMAQALDVPDSTAQRLVQHIGQTSTRTIARVLAQGNLVGMTYDDLFETVEIGE